MLCPVQGRLMLNGSSWHVPEVTLWEAILVPGDITALSLNAFCVFLVLLKCIQPAGLGIENSPTREAGDAQGVKGKCSRWQKSRGGARQETRGCGKQPGRVFPSDAFLKDALKMQRGERRSSYPEQIRVFTEGWQCRC